MGSPASNPCHPSAAISSKPGLSKIVKTNLQIYGDCKVTGAP